VQHFICLVRQGNMERARSVLNALEADTARVDLPLFAALRAKCQFLLGWHGAGVFDEDLAGELTRSLEAHGFHGELVDWLVISSERAVDAGKVPAAVRSLKTAEQITDGFTSPPIASDVAFVKAKIVLARDDAPRARALLSQVRDHARHQSRYDLARRCEEALAPLETVPPGA
jgi:hypothetical protein